MQKVNSLGGRGLWGLVSGGIVPSWALPLPGSVASGLMVGSRLVPFYKRRKVAGTDLVPNVRKG